MRRLPGLAMVATLACTLVPALASEPPAAGRQVVVRDAWARATPPGTAVAAVYLTLQGGARPDELVGVTTEVAAMTQIHAVTATQGVSRMRETRAVPLPAATTVVFAPHGLHLMLMDLRRPLVAGDTFEVTLRFAEAGPRVARVAVVAADPPAPTGH
jgi:periplasmic copper chaperone A